MDNFARIADDDTVARDIEIDIRIWSNQHIVAYRHFSDDNGIGADPYLIPDRWRAFTLAAVFTPNGYARGYVAVTADFCLCIDNNRAVMPYEESFSYLRFCGDMEGIFFIQNLKPVSVVQIQPLVVL